MEYQTFTLENGLKVVVHEDHSTKIAVLNLLYDVGSRDETEDKTGFAHLFEHLMFGGSGNIPLFDEPLQKVGGENNAFTSPDLTNYYTSVPSHNLETAFWLESDRMLSLSFDPQVLATQQKVVIEEFKQRYLNQPYGDVWLKLRPLAYQKHAYQWPTIGKEISHVENATMADVKAFFDRYYVPNNAILVVAGDVDLAAVERLTNKWFGPIPSGKNPDRKIAPEPKQTEERKIKLEADVPLDAFYKVYHMPARLDPTYHAADLLSDVLGRGNSSRLHTQLVKENQLLNSVSAYVTGSIDPGLLVLSGKLKSGVVFDQVEELIDSEIKKLVEIGIQPAELDKAKIQAESSHEFMEMELLNRAFNLAYFTLLGDTALVNLEVEMIRRVSESDIVDQAKKMLTKSNCSTLYYLSKTA